MNEINILDKVIKSQEEQKKASLNPQELVDFLLFDLTPRQKEIIKARYGLDRPKRETLEKIGQKFGITRERVRQIENNSLSKALQTAGIQEKLSDLLSMTTKHIQRGGYMRLEQALFEELLENSQNIEIDSNCLRFILNKFLSDYIQPVDIVYTERAWKLSNKDLSHYHPIIDGIKSILKTKDKPLYSSEILAELDKELTDTKIQNIKQELEDWEAALGSYLEVSQHFKKNLFGKWGLIDWRLVNPKRMRDKVYLVLMKHKQPLHYKLITEKINDEKFDNKQAHPATIHNELILDERFVLIGRGIYALASWGYKSGVIADVIKEVLDEAGVPLTKDEIIKEVLKRRMVKKGSVNLVLSDKNVFERLEDGSYALKSDVGD